VTYVDQQGAFSLDAVYVLSVKTFSERITHIRSELARHQLDFEFVFDYDADELDRALVERTFEPGKLRAPHQSLVLKHAQAWRLALARGQQRILILEDDVVLSERFEEGIQRALAAARALAPGWLIFLGGADTKVPNAFFLSDEPLFALPLPTAEGYITDAAAMQQRLDWMSRQRVARPADHLINQIDHDCGIAQYWLRTPIVEQGSVFGMFTSKLDKNRLKHSAMYNRLRYHWNKFQRRRLRAWIVRLRARLSGVSRRA